MLSDAVDAGSRLGAIFKEPTITPSAEQCEGMGLKKPLCSPNGAMRRGWNGITISRDTIHIEGMELGFKRPVFFERHAVGGEYSAGSAMVGKGVLKTIYYPDGNPAGSQICAPRRPLNPTSFGVFECMRTCKRRALQPPFPGHCRGSKSLPKSPRSVMRIAAADAPQVATKRNAHCSGRL